MRFPLQQDGDIVAGDLEAGGFLERDRVRLVRRLLQHRRESKELAVRRFIDDHFLVVFVHGGDPHFPRDHDVRLPARVSDLVDAFARRECLELNLAGQHRGFVVVQQRKEWNASQHFRLARHRRLLGLPVDPLWARRMARRHTNATSLSVGAYFFARFCL